MSVFSRLVVQEHLSADRALCLLEKEVKSLKDQNILTLSSRLCSLEKELEDLKNELSLLVTGSFKRSNLQNQRVQRQDSRDEERTRPPATRAP